METTNGSKPPCAGSVSRVETQGGAAVVTLSGRLDTDSAAEVVETLAEQAQRQSRIAVDLVEVTETDSAGLGALVRAVKAARDAGGDLVLVRPSEGVSRLLDETGLDQVLRVFSHPSDACEYLMKS